MATVFAGFTNVYAGRLTSSIPPGFGLGYGTIACVIDNTSNCVLQVFHAGGMSYLQPNVSAAFPCGVVLVPQVQPVTNAAAGTIMGVISTTFYDVNDGYPTGYPSAIVPVSAGQQLMVYQLSSNGTAPVPFTMPITAIGWSVLVNSILPPTNGTVIMTIGDLGGSIPYTWTVNNVVTGQVLTLGWLGTSAFQGPWTIEIDGVATIYATIPS
jgi:hypothetical protein